MTPLPADIHRPMAEGEGAAARLRDLRERVRAKAAGGKAARNQHIGGSSLAAHARVPQAPARRPRDADQHSGDIPPPTRRRIDDDQIQDAEAGRTERVREDADGGDGTRTKRRRMGQADIEDSGVTMDISREPSSGHEAGPASRVLAVRFSSRAQLLKNIVGATPPAHTAGRRSQHDASCPFPRVGAASDCLNEGGITCSRATKGAKLAVEATAAISSTRDPAPHERAGRATDDHDVGSRNARPSPRLSDGVGLVKDTRANACVVGPLPRSVRQRRSASLAARSDSQLCASHPRAMPDLPVADYLPLNKQRGDGGTAVPAFPSADPRDCDGHCSSQPPLTRRQLLNTLR